MIMLLTDGGTDYAEDVFKKYNPDGNKVNPFSTYATIGYYMPFIVKNTQLLFLKIAFTKETFI